MHAKFVNLSVPSNTLIHTLFLLFYVYKVCHLSFKVLIPLMKVLDWTKTFGIYSKLILASVVSSIVPKCKNLATQKSFTRRILCVC